jgi:hypothetical protein
MELEEELRGLSGCGTGKVMVAESTIKGAGRGLYAIQEIREKGIICDYRGKVVPQSEVEKDSYDGTYVYI